MPPTVRVKPTSGPVPKEGGGWFAEDGEEVRLTIFVRRRIQDGSLEVVDEPDVAEKPPRKRKGGE